VTVPATGTEGETSTLETPGTAARSWGTSPSVATRARPSNSDWALTTPSTSSRPVSSSGVAAPAEAVRT
jgi:hypothetical protein